MPERPFWRRYLVGILNLILYLAVILVVLLVLAVVASLVQSHWGPIDWHSVVVGFLAIIVFFVFALFFTPTK